MSNKLKTKTLNAIFWSFLEYFGQQSIQFIISIILAQIAPTTYPKSLALSSS